MASHPQKQVKKANNNKDSSESFTFTDENGNVIAQGSTSDLHIHQLFIRYGLNHYMGGSQPYKIEKTKKKK